MVVVTTISEERNFKMETVNYSLSPSLLYVTMFSIFEKTCEIHPASQLPLSPPNLLCVISPPSSVAGDLFSLTVSLSHSPISENLLSLEIETIEFSPPR
ncbi:hypothetical protein L6452_33251 [Arctium lappa]|uniref:Uncharacterized protein n=1 Tax=Arctium lappa TaxID=4217 RepID=A0ACB8Z7S2_ARCLA|nr:hypothetical protein L6452_33251 [Arctium lappa]